jgi:pyrroline-5-carboxylate reductase
MHAKHDAVIDGAVLDGAVLFVGGGKMARALAEGLVGGGLLQPDRLRVADRSAEARRWWNERFPEAAVFEDAAAAERAAASGPGDTVILAVKPHQIAAAIEQLHREISGAWQQSLVVSVAAGVGLETLVGWLGSNRVARVMPNTPALVGSGASAFCLASGGSEQDAAVLERMLGSCGLALQVPESQMDAVTGLSGSGPAYVFLFIEALADGGVRAGLPREQALQLAAQTVLGAARMVQQTGQHPGVLKDAVTSPGGTTIAAVGSLEQNAFRGAVMAAVKAAAERSAQLA